MRKKKKENGNTMNIALSSLLVLFVCLLFFSVGVITGKGWSDREYTIRHIEQDSHLQSAKADQKPLGEDMSDKEVELLTQRALEQARAEQAEPEPTSQARKVASQNESSDTDKEEDKEEQEQPSGREASTAKVEEKADRKVSSLPPRPTTPAPKSIEYTVQVAAYKTLDEAEGHSQRLIDKGFPAFPVKAKINGQVWYRVSIGSFKNRKQAMKYEKALKKQAVVKNTFVQKITRLK
jgi:cell division protein FtsN